MLAIVNHPAIRASVPTLTCIPYSGNTSRHMIIATTSPMAILKSVSIAEPRRDWVMEGFSAREGGGGFSGEAGAGALFSGIYAHCIPRIFTLARFDIESATPTKKGGMAPLLVRR